ncbi:MAG: response regulator [Bacteroidetes bacterium]|nr:response regulator [Bacteroidota bacterium]
MLSQILLVEDDQDDQEFFLGVLSELRPASVCHVSNNGMEALLHLKETKSKPSLIFLDLNMPVMDGYEFLTEVKNRTELNKIAVVVFTTSSNPNDIEKAWQLGASYFFTKPNGMNVFKQKLSLVFEKDFSDTPVPYDSYVCR